MGKNRRAWKGWGGAWAFATAACFGGVEAPPGANTLLAQASPYTYHWSYDPRHAKYSWLFSLEVDRPDRWLEGAAYFNNSFNQKCEYLYVGKVVWAQDEDVQGWYLKVTGGVILGYKGQYQNKIPYNHDGVAPGLLPSLGYQRGPWNAQLNVLGFAGLVVTVGYDLARW